MISRKRIGGTLIGVAGTCAVVLLAMGAVAAARGTGGVAPTDVPDSHRDETTRTFDRPLPLGKMPVVDGSGEVAGFIDADAYESGERFPALALTSSEPTVHGLRVTDAAGSVVGYFLEEVGFVDLATARDPGLLDAAYAEERRPLELGEEEQKALRERARPQGLVPRS